MFVGLDVSIKTLRNQANCQSQRGKSVPHIRLHILLLEDSASRISILSHITSCHFFAVVFGLNQLSPVCIKGLLV